MSYGIQLSASGMMTALYAQDVYTNNLANIDTPGFKADIPSTVVRQAVRQEDHLEYLPSNKMLERLGGGVMLQPNFVDFSQGPLRETGNPYDLAIEGNGFFVVKDETDKQTDKVKLTRDGRFTRDASGRLVMATTGLPVLDVNNRTIQLPTGVKVAISEDGTISAAGREVAHLQVADVPDRSALKKMGQSLFSADSNALSGSTAATRSVMQGQIEQSSADEMRMYMLNMSAARDVEGNVSMIQQFDRMMDRAINGLGRVA